MLKRMIPLCVKPDVSFAALPQYTTYMYFIRLACGNTQDAAASPCAIPIKHRQFGSSSHFDKVKAWSHHDSYLDWYGEEPLQGKYQGHAAAGTPAVWTTNNAGSAGYSDLNTYVLTNF